MNNKISRKIIVCVLNLLCLVGVSFGEVLPRAISTDKRIKIINYFENNVFKITGYYGMQTSLQLSKDEKVSTIALGDTTGWQIHPVGHMIFIKPVELDADTNMTLITNKRIYFIDLVAKEVTKKNKNQISYNIKFLYHDEENNNQVTNEIFDTSESIEDLDHPEKYNYNYYVSGDVDIAPLKIFDDGKLTFVQFSNQVKDMPAIFTVDDDLHEHLVNYIPSKSKTNLIIIEQVFNKLTLRLGRKILCIYNEGYSNNKHYIDPSSRHYMKNI